MEFKTRSFMNYLKSFCFNFLAVFFSNYLLPGIEIVQQTKLPQIGGDMLFAIVVGLVNSFIYPLLKMIDQPISVGRIALSAFSIALGAYIILKFARFGIEITTLEGFFFAVSIVAVVGFVTNFFEMRRSIKYPGPPSM